MQDKIKNKETLEEVAERETTFPKMCYPNTASERIAKNNFIAGAKWQQEQIGKSEFLQRLRATISDAEARRLIFEQFKNK